MKTTVLIDDHLMKEAMRAIGARTKKEAILAGLNALIRGKQREIFRKELGSFDIDLTLEQLEKIRYAN